jgi:subtilisin family serine protease
MKMAEKGGRTRAGFLAAWAALMVTVAGVTGGEVSPREAGLAAAATPAKSTPAGPEYVPGQIIVKLKNSQPGQIQALSQDTIMQGHQAILRRLQTQYGVSDGGPVFRRAHERLRMEQGLRGKSAIRNPQSESALLPFYLLRIEGDVLRTCAELRRDGAVESAQPNYIYRPCAQPNDPEFADQYAHQLIQMPDAWEISTGSRDIVVAVLGTGVDVNHPDLKDNIWVNQGEIPDNKIDDDGNGYVDDVHGWNFDGGNGNVVPGINDPYGEHETQVAGVIAGTGNNGIGVCGVNWQCSIMVLRLSMEYASDEVADALDYAAANGARVVNMSFGGDTFGPEGDQVVKTAIDNAFAAGVLLVASAGNSDTSRPHFPAAYPNVMAVASTNGEDSKTGHSTFGLWVDIAAPGTDIVTTDLDNQYIATAGTSFSGPYVAAVGALLLAYRPDLTNIQVRAILENTTDPVYYEGLDPNQCYIGTGRVNAYQTLLAADRDYPLGEIVTPAPAESFAADVNAVELCVFVHGDSYRLDYRLYEQGDWTTVAQGGAPTDPNGLVYTSLPQPGIGTYELRLSVSRGQYTHTDRKLFSIEIAADEAPWPRPAADDLEMDEFFLGSALCLDVNGDGRNEILQAAYNYGSDYDYWGMMELNLWTEDGNSLPGWPKVLDSFYTPGKAVGDIDGDGDYEVIATSDYDNMVHAWHAENGEVVDGNWPVGVGSWSGWIVANPVLADLDGDGVSEIIVALDAESSSEDGLYALRGDGTFLWQRRYTSQGPMSVADFDGDGDVEITLCGYGPGLSRVYTFILDHNGQSVVKWRGGSPKGTAIADLDGDGRPELVFCTEEDVEAVRVDGSTLWKAKVSDPLDTAGGISIGDLDGDGYPEIYISSLVEADEFSFTRVYGFDHQGRPLTDAGYPKTVMGYPGSIVPVIGDIDGDGQKELVIAATGEPLVAWKADGSTAPGFPMLSVTGGEESSPTLADLDQDGDLEMMVADDDYRFHVLDLPAPYEPELIDWGMSRHDPQNSGWTLPAPRLDPVSVPGEIKPGERLQVQVTAANPANLPLRWSIGNLPEGAYYDTESHTVFWKPTADQAFRTYTLSFLVTDGIRQNSRSVSVTVVPDARYYADMNTDPSWQLDEGWAWGAPTGAGSWNGDPNAGHTGANVLGYALDGNYANNLAEARYATTGPIDCTGYGNIRLSFWRWLGVEAPYDYACVQVSNDGSTWIDLWSVGQSHVSDRAWQYVEYAVPAGIAEGHATVYFRWGLGPTDDSVAYPGWNIDDVQVTGDPVK